MKPVHDLIEQRPRFLGSRPWSLLDKTTLMRIVRRVTRMATLLLGLSALIVAYGLWAYDSKAFGKFPVWTVWPLFLASGLATLAWTWWPDSVPLAIWSGVFATLSVLGRCAGTVAFYLIQGYALQWPAVELLIGQNVPALVLVFVVWFFLVVPLARTLDEDKDAEGDE